MMKLGTMILLAAVGAPLVGLAAADEPEYTEVAESEVLPGGEPQPTFLTADVRKRFAGRTLAGQYAVYLDPDGKVTKVDVITSAPGADELITAWLTSLKYTAAHRHVRFLFKPNYGLAPADYRPPPPHALYAARISGDYPRLPDEVKKRNVGKQVVGFYIVSIDRDGHVSAVETKVSIPGGDAAIAETVKTWRYKPMALPLRVPERFVFDVRP